jgi:hypothetical protein
MKTMENNKEERRDQKPKYKDINALVMQSQ